MIPIKARTTSFHKKHFKEVFSWYTSHSQAVRALDQFHINIISKTCCSRQPQEAQAASDFGSGEEQQTYHGYIQELTGSALCITASPFQQISSNT